MRIHANPDPQQRKSECLIAIAGRVHEAIPARAEEEARPGDQAAAQELKAEGDPHQEAVQGHLQDTDQAVQGAQGPGASVTLCIFFRSVDPDSLRI